MYFISHKKYLYFVLKRYHRRKEHETEREKENTDDCDTDIRIQRLFMKTKKYSRFCPLICFSI